VFYDEHHRRRKHRIPNSLSPAVVTQADAEAYARRWYQLHVAEQTLKSVRALEQEQPRTEEPPSAPASTDSPTFREVAQRWTSGKLAVEFPDHVKEKSSNRTDELRLGKYVYGVVGDVLISEFSGPHGMDLVERVSSNMTAVNPGLRPTSRRHVLQTVSKILNYAVYPLKLLERNPLPLGFLPKRGKTPAKVCLFPGEERRLLACPKIPIQWRLLIGILAREGLRLSELAQLEWSDVDLDTGTVDLDKNKTDDPRLWALDPHVVEALSRWKKMLSPQAKNARRLILHPKSGRLFNPKGAARRLRTYARKAGLERSQLYEKSEERIALRIHDLRATFVTVSLAQGQTETWVADRTGHRSSQMIATYRRVARTYRELNLGPLAPLCDGIPELAELANK
jgi:integrase